MTYECENCDNVVEVGDASPSLVLCAECNHGKAVWNDTGHCGYGELDSPYDVERYIQELECEIEELEHNQGYEAPGDVDRLDFLRQELAELKK